MNIKSLAPFILLFGAMIGLFACNNIGPTPGSTEATTQALNSPPPPVQRRPPPSQCSSDVCQAQQIECGTFPVGKEVYDCGDCANKDSCVDGQCVACQPDGTLTPYCDGDNLMQFDSCGATSLVGACAYGCANDACVIPVCGDGVTQAAIGEECDDGNQVDTDLCTNECKKARCGDKIVSPESFEQCDDGNTDNTDGCLSNCKLVVCGDGIIMSVGGEECEDGNTIDTDACTNQCKRARCGDGIVRAVIEQCDDGNLIDGDGCSHLCRKEPK